jgi:hypothetical protein
MSFEMLQLLRPFIACFLLALCTPMLILITKVPKYTYFALVVYSVGEAVGATILINYLLAH